MVEVPFELLLAIVLFIRHELVHDEETLLRASGDSHAVLNQDLWLGQQALFLRVIKMEKGLKIVINAFHVPCKKIFPDADKNRCGQNRKHENISAEYVVKKPRAEIGAEVASEKRNVPFSEPGVIWQAGVFDVLGKLLVLSKQRFSEHFLQELHDWEHFVVYAQREKPAVSVEVYHCVDYFKFQPTANLEQKSNQKIEALAVSYFREVGSDRLASFVEHLSSHFDVADFVLEKGVATEGPGHVFLHYRDYFLLIAPDKPLVGIVVNARVDRQRKVPNCSAVVTRRLVYRQRFFKILRVGFSEESSQLISALVIRP